MPLLRGRRRRLINAGHAVADAWSELSQDIEDDAVLSLVDRAVEAGAHAGAAARPAVRLSKLARRTVGEVAARRRSQPTAQMTGAAG